MRWWPSKRLREVLAKSNVFIFAWDPPPVPHPNINPNRCTPMAYSWVSCDILRFVFCKDG